MNHLTAEQQALLALIRRSLWDEQLDIPKGINWEKVGTMAKEQGVVSFVYDGAVKAKAAVPEALLQRWKQMMFYGALTNERLLLAQDEILQWFHGANIPAVILKGSSVARYYPQPDLRVLGDIDVLVKKTDLEQAQTILEQHGYTVHENDPGYHISFGCKGISVELHYDVTSLPASVGGDRMKAVTARFMEDLGQGRLEQHHFSVLSESNQAVMLLLHMIRHMFGSCIGLRQVCDWAMYVANADAEDLTGHTLPALARGGILHYAKVATKTCVEVLGLPADKAAWCLDVADEKCRAFTADLFRGGNMGSADQDGLSNLFTNSKTMGTEQSPLTAFFARMSDRCYDKFPITRKCRILLPVFWVFLPVRYMVRSALGLRPRKSVLRVMQKAKQKRSLYEMLNLFQPED